MKQTKKQALALAFDPPPPARKEAFCATLCAQNPARATRKDFFFLQLSCMRLRVWGVQLCLLPICALARYLPQVPLAAVWVVCALLPLCCLAAAAEITRSDRFGMAELEACGRYRLQEVLLARLILLTAGNAVLLLCAQVLLFGASGFGFVRFGLYFYTPLLASAVGCMVVINRVPPADAPYACAAVCGAVCVAALSVFLQWPALLDAHRAGGWLLLLAALCAAGAGQLRQWKNRMEEPTWNLCWTA